ncbi:DNA kinase/phosphatase Pnk1 [Blastocladiella emersonii ATCC 22665]|nr:DNA kinase/phosphatase Pnk1 [Blastocladiella emersonii ATCC 22665]
MNGDNTNPTSWTRRKYIEVAEEFEVPVRSVHFTTPVDIARHLNHFRAFTSVDDELPRDLLPEEAFSKYEYRLSKPSTSEGFEEVIEIPFRPCFKTPEDLRLACMWLF